MVGGVVEHQSMVVQPYAYGACGIESGIRFTFILFQFLFYTEKNSALFSILLKKM
jgi:hypothetical protein